MHDNNDAAKSMPRELSSSTRQATPASCDCEISFASRRGFPHPGHPSQKYTLNWEINQAGLGRLSLGNYFGYSTVLIKRRERNRERSCFPALQSAFHPNLVGLVEAFQDEDFLYLTYNYDGLVVSLSQVTSTPDVLLGEPEIAGIYRGVLCGLQYIHERLGIVHGNIDGNNILLTPEGTVKIANVGDAMLKEDYISFLDDREKLCRLFLALSQGENRKDNPPVERNRASSLSFYARHFVAQLLTAPYSCLFEHVFLEQGGMDGRAWYLIPRYLDTILYWGVLRE